MTYLTIEDTIGNTPLVQLQYISGEGNTHRDNVIPGRFEGNSPASSVEGRPTLSMIKRAEVRGRIKSGDTLIKATSGSTDIALAMAATMRDYRMVLITSEDLSVERRQSMAAYSAEIILTPVKGGMGYARDLADAMEKEDKGVILDQFASPNNPLAHYEATGPELWRDTEGRITHFVSTMSTTGTVTGVSRFLKEKNTNVQIIGAQPEKGSRVSGIRKWPEAYMPKIYDPKYIDRTEPVSQSDVGYMTRRMAHEEGIFCGISATGALCVALRVAEEVESAMTVFVVYGQDDRYLSTGVFPA